MINNNSIQENDEKSNEKSLEKVEESEENLEKENNEIKSPQNKNEELHDIKEEEEDEYYPIMSRIKRDLKEKKNKKFGKKEEAKNEKAKKNKSNSNSKLPFMKISKKNNSSNRLNILLTLEPFHTDFKENSDKKGEEYLKALSEDYKEEKYNENNIIYKYGDEADKFFVVNKGNVSLFMPFTETVNMNIDEFYIYLLRLRRYNEIEMLNDVLLLNQGKFMFEFDESFDIDEYILKLYNTSLKLKFDPSSLYKTQAKKKIPKIKNSDNKCNTFNTDNKKTKLNIKSYKNANIYKIRKINIKNIGENNEFDDNILKTFNEREIKEVILRIEDEIIETMKWIMPDKLYDIYEKIIENKRIRKMSKIPDKLINAYKQYNSNIVNSKDYLTRILPKKIANKNLQRKEMIIMKYLHISTLSKGYYFGDFCPDSLTLFCPKYYNYAKSTRIPVKIHNHYIFRNMTAISDSNDTCLISFNKKLFSTYISKFIENITSAKKKFLLNNPLFKNSNISNLIRAYSTCFHEVNVKEGEIIVKENDNLNESNINLYFIIKGEFQAVCKKTIFQIDEIIKLLGREENIMDTFPKVLIGLIGTKYYNELANKVLNLKLNFLTKNDIIGISEVFLCDKYFNNVICTNPDSKVLKVDMRIVKLLVDSDDVILSNKNIIVYHKYQMLADILLKQRKIYFDSFFNQEKHNINRNILIKEQSNNNTDNEKSDNNKDNSKEFLGDNFTKSAFEIKKDKYNNVRTIQKIYEVKSSSFDEKLSQFKDNNQLIKNIKMIKNKVKTASNKNKLVKNLGDLDCMLANLNGNFTLSDKRLERSMKFRKKYFQKMEKLNQEKKLREEERKKQLENQALMRRSQSNFNIKGFQKSVNIYRNMFKELPLLPYKDNNIKSDGHYKLIIPYRVSILRKSNSANNINPLAYDDFNRYYNTTQYFKFKKYYNREANFLEERKVDQKKDYFEYNIEFKSDMEFKNKKDNKMMRTNLLTRKLRSIYKGRLDKILYKYKIKNN